MRVDSASDDGVIDPVYLPFPAEQVRSHLASSLRDNAHERVERDLMYYLNSAGRYHRFKNTHPITRGMPLSKQRRPRQIEKDERFWVVTCLGSIGSDDEFDAAIGRLLKTMQPGDTKYGIAGPSLPAMHHHVSRIHPEIRDLLRLHYLIVDEGGSVRTDTQYFD